MLNSLCLCVLFAQNTSVMLIYNFGGYLLPLESYVSLGLYLLKFPYLELNDSKVLAVLCGSYVYYIYFILFVHLIFSTMLLVANSV